MESPKNSILRQLLRMACWGCLRDDIAVDYPGFNCINGLLAACHILTWISFDSPLAIWAIPARP